MSQQIQGREQEGGQRKGGCLKRPVGAEFKENKSQSGALSPVTTDHVQRRNSQRIHCSFSSRTSPSFPNFDETVTHKVLYFCCQRMKTDPKNVFYTAGRRKTGNRKRRRRAHGGEAGPTWKRLAVSSSSSWPSWSLTLDNLSHSSSFNSSSLLTHTHTHRENNTTEKNKCQMK